MRDVIKISKDGEKCALILEETGKGMRLSSKGKGCRKIMGKEYFKEVEIEV